MGLTNARSSRIMKKHHTESGEVMANIFERMALGRIGSVLAPVRSFARHQNLVWHQEQRFQCASGSPPMT
jgi:hypothetical protein